MSNQEITVQRGEVPTIPIVVRDGLEGPRTAADGVPTVAFLLLNNTGVDETTVGYGIAVTAAQDDTPAAITGLYTLTFTSSAFAKGDKLLFGVEVVVGGQTYTTEKLVRIVDDPAARVVVQ